MQTINQKNKYLKTFTLSLLVILSFQSFVYSADTIPTQISDLEEQVDVTINPRYPQPGETVTISLDAYGIDLDNTKITWSSNGQTLSEGKGQKNITITADAAAKSTVIKAVLLPPNSKRIEKTITITPQSVDVLWEAKTYTPPFYKGKAMFSPQESLKFVAMPDQISPSSAIFKWTMDDEVLGSKSGFGKNILTYTGDILLKQVDLSVEVSDGKGNTAKKNLSLAPLNPEVYIYEDNYLYGKLFNKELSTLFDLGQNQESTISIYPFFYGTNTRSNSNLEYKWTINGQRIDVPTNQNDMTFRNTENINGKSSVGVSVTNTDNYFEDVQKSTLINFNRANVEFAF